LKKYNLLAGILAFVLVAGFGTPVFGETVLYAVDKDSDELRVLDPTDASTISSITITLAGSNVNGVQGLAIDPTTEDMYALLKASGFSGRALVTVDPTTGIATLIGNTGDGFAGLEFDSAGTLYGITGDGASTPETLFILSKIDATLTLVCGLGAGDDGETIVNANGIWYHFSGHDPTSDYVMETIDLDNNCATTNIPRTGDFEEETIAGAYCAELGQIIVGENHFSPTRLMSVSETGVGTLIGVTQGVFTVAGLACMGDAETNNPSNNVVGGKFLPIDTTALLLSGAQINAAWIMSALVVIGSIAFGALYITTRNPNNMRNIKVILRDYLDR